MIRRRAASLVTVACALAVLVPSLAHAKGQGKKKAPQKTEAPAAPEDEPEREEPSGEPVTAEGDDSSPKTGDEPAGSDEATTSDETNPDTASEEDAAPVAEAPSRPPAPTTPFARFWVGVSGGFDFAFIPSGKGLCTLTPTGHIANGDHAYCTDSEGRDLPQLGNARQNALLLPGSGVTNGGGTLGDARLLLVVEYAITPSVLIGGRAGYVFNAYPAVRGLGGRPEATRHLHGELRATYVFGDAPLAHVGFAPLVFFAAGAGAHDGHRSSSIRYQGVAAQDPADVWFVSGPWFAALGAGARYTFSPRAAFTAAVRADASFGPFGSLLTMGPEIAFLYGF
jgi:hypothetical protein